MYYCNSRYYNPEWGRWIQPDGVKYLEPNNINGLNLYSYANNNPIGIAYRSSSVGVSVPNQLINQNFSLLMVHNLGINKINYSSSVHWKNELFAKDWPSFLVLTNDSFNVLDWSISLYKGSLYLNEAETHSLYISGFNFDTYVGVDFKKKEFGFRLGGNLLSVGYDGKYIDASVDFVGWGYFLYFDNGELQVKADPLLIPGFAVSIDFGLIVKDMFGWEW